MKAIFFIRAKHTARAGISQNYLMKFYVLEEHSRTILIQEIPYLI